MLKLIARDAKTQRLKHTINVSKDQRPPSDIIESMVERKYTRTTLATQPVVAYTVEPNMHNCDPIVTYREIRVRIPLSTDYASPPIVPSSRYHRLRGEVSCVITPCIAKLNRRDPSGSSY
ncbi:hypothetical protein EVAR_81215_1 [Eumeta japonica]|uniref:Uncharacterized protein n=1 Tax=Eumeta variegata TaxID=151549 RepID=A0A4C1V0V6_EUMVA|nr:hypothetical protein EVAR_81215_1 [Eumeta japonica]